MSYNNISDLNITCNHPNLFSLSLNNNQIEKITAVKNLPNLKSLDLSDNLLTKLPLRNFDNLPSLKIIYVERNPIKSISGLEKFSSNSLKIATISPSNFSKFELEKLESYLHSIDYKFDEGFVYKPTPPQAEFIINKHLTLCLENGKINLYVDNELFEQCAALLLNIPKNNIPTFDSINSIDEAEEIFKLIDNNDVLVADIPIMAQFWGHASNFQAWVENNYDTCFLLEISLFRFLKN